MQTLWARILAGEANAPGKFSKRTVNLVGSLGIFYLIRRFGCIIMS